MASFVHSVITYIGYFITVNMPVNSKSKRECWKTTLLWLNLKGKKKTMLTWKRGSDLNISSEQNPISFAERLNPSQ